MTYEVAYLMRVLKPAHIADIGDIRKCGYWSDSRHRHYFLNLAHSSSVGGVTTGISSSSWFLRNFASLRESSLSVREIIMEKKRASKLHDKKIRPAAEWHEAFRSGAEK